MLESALRLVPEVLKRPVKRALYGPSRSVREFQHMGDRPDQQRAPGELESIFWDNAGRPIHKWHYYFPIYERHFAPFRGAPVRLLEIGVQNGGSLQMWRTYFGAEATLYGVDIDPACRQFDKEAGSIRIGSQDDADFLGAVVEEMGGLDIVIDDGSHLMQHNRRSFEILFPALAIGGVYLIEDLHTSYKPKFGSGYRRAGSTIELLKTIVDDMHHWHHDRGQKVAQARDAVSGVHMYGGVAVIEKAETGRPQHSVRGYGGSIDDPKKTVGLGEHGGPRMTDLEKLKRDEIADEIAASGRRVQELESTK